MINKGFVSVNSTRPDLFGTAHIFKDVDKYSMFSITGYVKG